MVNFFCQHINTLSIYGKLGEIVANGGKLPATSTPGWCSHPTLSSPGIYGLFTDCSIFTKAFSLCGCLSGTWYAVDGEFVHKNLPCLAKISSNSSQTSSLPPAILHSYLNHLLTSSNSFVLSFSFFPVHYYCFSPSIAFPFSSFLLKSESHASSLFSMFFAYLFRLSRELWPAMHLLVLTSAPSTSS